jgi:2-iminobutanoate/2-iminopropanoate deaminase
MEDHPRRFDGSRQSPEVNKFDLLIGRSSQNAIDEDSMSSRRYITEVPNVPVSLSPISNAVVVGNQCWISGQLSLDNDGGYLPGTAYEEAERAFGFVIAIAVEAGFSKAEIVYVDIAFKDLGDLDAVNTYFALLFPKERRPARTVYQAAKLPLGAKVKVQAVAARG